MRRNTAFQGTLNRPGPTPASASHDNPRSFFQDAKFFDRPKPIGRNDTTPKDVANAIRVRRSRGNENAPQPAARAGEGSRPPYND